MGKESRMTKHINKNLQTFENNTCYKNKKTQICTCLSIGGYNHGFQGMNPGGAIYSGGNCLPETKPRKSEVPVIAKVIIWL